MTTDRSTKILLALIAIGLLLNAAAPLFRPEPVAAQIDRLSSIDRRLSDMEDSLTSIKNDVSSLDGSLDSIMNLVTNIEDGTCTNGKIC